MKKILKVTFSLILFLAIVLVSAKAYAEATNNPVFPTREEVKQWIAEAVGQTVYLPPFTSEIAPDQSYISPNNPDEYYIDVDLLPRLMNQEFQDETRGETWGIAHLPSGDIVNTGDLSGINWFVPASEMPSIGTPIDVDIYTHYAGKTIHLNTTITNWVE